MTVDMLLEHEAKLSEALERKHRTTSGLEQYSRPSNGHRQPSGDPASAQQLSPGDQFVRSNEYTKMRSAGSFSSELHRNEFSVIMSANTSLVSWQKALQHKALIYSGTGVAGSLVQNDVQQGVLSILQREINVLDLVPRLSTDSDTIEYVREEVFTNAAAPVAEATATTGTTGTKPESTLTFSTQTSPVRTIAHWVPVTNKTLSDAPQIRGIINTRLLLGLTLTLETQIISGNGVGENLLGILNSGIQARGLGSDTILDAIFRARTMVRVNGKARPTAIVMHPNDWEAVRLARENAASAIYGGYLMGPPSMVGANTLGGLPGRQIRNHDSKPHAGGRLFMGCSLFNREEAVDSLRFYQGPVLRKGKPTGPNWGRISSWGTPVLPQVKESN